MFIKGNIDFSQTNFAPAKISSFNSVMLFVDICFNDLLTFQVSARTIFESWFLNDDNLDFFSDMILFNFFNIQFFFLC